LFVIPDGNPNPAYLDHKYSPWSEEAKKEPFNYDKKEEDGSITKAAPGLPPMWKRFQLTGIKDTNSSTQF
jgi:hypothetical protein